MICNMKMSQDEKDDGRGLEMESNYNVSLNTVEKDSHEEEKE